MSISIPAPGAYRLISGVRVVPWRDGKYIAVCAYPLRLIPLTSEAARLLLLCTCERSIAQLAAILKLPGKRVVALCEHLRWKGLLAAGPPEPLAVWPAISIIVPAHNRAAELARCLRSLLALDYPIFEIIVVNDGSTDTTSAMLQSLAQEAAARNVALCVVTHAQCEGVAHSRNSGASAASYDLLAYIDSDCVASPSWLKALVPTFRDMRVVAIGGLIRAYERLSLPGRYEDVASSLHMGELPQRLSLKGPLTYLPTANFLLRRSAWQRVDGFADLAYGEDVDFCRRLLETGAQIYYLPYGTVYHAYRTTPGAFLRTRIAYASSEADLQQRHPAMRRVLFLPPLPATFAGLLIAAASFLLTDLFSPHRKTYSVRHFSSVLLALSALLPLALSARRSLRTVREQHVPIATPTVIMASLRSHLSYTYHLSRHLARYYTPFLLFAGLFFPPLFAVACVLCTTVFVVDYLRLKPAMNFWQFAYYALLDNCAYALGVVKGCVARKTWKPLLPRLKHRL